MHVLAAGHGDCLWVEYGDPCSPTRILVDGGTAGTFKPLKAALEMVRTPSPSHELLIVSHVDADHIGGTLALLEDPELAHQFKEVWFNGRSHLIQAQDRQPFGAVQGERLTLALRRTPERWNTAFQHGPVVLPNSGAPPEFSIGPGSVTVLSPRVTELAALLSRWDSEIRAAGLAPSVKPAKVRPKRDGWQVLGSLNVAKLANERVAPDAAAANGSSIATLIEFNGKRLLLSADAHPHVLLDGIRRISPSGPLQVDAWKLPHHGSAANVTDELLNAVDAKTLIFSSNGAYFEHPDKIAVAKVLRRYQGQGVRLLFNYRTQYNAMWDSASLKEYWGYSTEYGKAKQGVSLNLI